MFYDVKKKVFVSDADMKQRGLPIDDSDLLASYGFFWVVFDKPKYNPETQGLEAYGSPEPSEDDATVYIQKMLVVELLPKFKETRLAQLANERWLRQTAGIQRGNFSIRTGPEDISRMMAAIQAMEATGLEKTEFKADSGWVTVTLAEFKDLFIEASTYVQDCYANEARLAKKVQDAKTISELNDIFFMTGWPKNSDAIRLESPEHMHIIEEQEREESKDTEI